MANSARFAGLEFCCDYIANFTLSPGWTLFKLKIIVIAILFRWKPTLRIGKLTFSLAEIENAITWAEI